MRKSGDEQVDEILQVEKLLNVYRVILPGSERILMVRMERSNSLLLKILH